MIWLRIAIQSLQGLILEKGFWRIDHLGEEMNKAQQRIYTFVTNAIKIIFIMGTFTFLSVFAMPILTEIRKLPLLCYHPINFLQSPIYEIVYIWQFINCVVIFMFVPSVSAIFFSSITFGYCQTMMLKKGIESLDMEYSYTPEMEKKCFEKIKGYVEYHSKLLE